MKAITKDFGSFDGLKTKFAETATTLFGSGWAWLVKDKSGKLDLRKTSNADVPFREDGVTPLLVCDVWEHAYYIDYRNARAKYVEGFWQHLNWKFAQENFDRGSLIELTDTMK